MGKVVLELLQVLWKEVLEPIVTFLVEFFTKWYIGPEIIIYTFLGAMILSVIIVIVNELKESQNKENDENTKE